MVTALIAVANGSEEIEFSSTFDVLVRAGFHVDIGAVGVSSENSVITLSRGLRILVDHDLAHFKSNSYDVFVIPGGMPGAEHLARSVDVEERLASQMAKRKYIAAICAAPALVLKPKGYLRGNATCYPSDPFVNQLGKECYLNETVVVSDNIITSAGPGTALDFALAIVKAVLGEAKAVKVAEALIHRRQ